MSAHKSIRRIVTSVTSSCLILLGATHAALAAAPPEAAVSAGLFDSARVRDGVAARNGNAIVVWTDNGTGLPGNPDPQPPFGTFDTLTVTEGAAARLTLGTAGGFTASPNINLTRMSGRNTAESVAIDSTNANAVVVVGIAGNDQDFGGQLTVSSSSDGGRTFVTRTVASAAAMPSVAFDDFGNCFVAYRDHGMIDPFEPESKLLLSVDRCRTFTEIFNAGFTFGVALAAGPQGVAFLSTTRDSLSRGAITTFATRGLGVVDAPVTRTISGSAITIGPDGQIAVGGHASVAIDADGFGPGDFGSPTLLSDTAAGVVLAYDRSGGIHRGRLYALYASSDFGSGGPRMLLRFSDDGVRFSTAQQINAVVSSNPAAGALANPAVAVDSAQGTLVATWQVVQIDNSQPSQRLRLRQVARAFAPPIVAGGLPESPTNFRSLSAVPGRVELAWTDRADNETAYEIQRSNLADGFEAPIVLPPNSTRFVDVMSDAINNAGFAYALRAVNAAGRSETIFVSVVTAATPPAPANTTATALSSSQIRVTWRDTSNLENKFIIERSTNGVDFITVRETLDSFSTTYVDENLPPATRFLYRVRAANNDVASAPSNVASAITLGANGPIAAPTNLTANATSSSSVTLGWENHSDDGQDIEVQRSKDGRRFTTIARTGGLVTVFFDRTVRARQTYFYRIRAMNGQRVSEFSNVASVTTPRR